MKFTLVAFGMAAALALAAWALWSGDAAAPPALSRPPTPAAAEPAPEPATEPAPPERAASSARAPALAPDADQAPSPGVGSLAGSVTDLAGAPIAGCRVRVQAARAEAVTDARGAFLFIDVAAGLECELALEAAGFARAQRGTFRIEADRQTNSGPIALVPECRIAGRVLDARGAPIPGVRVEAQCGSGRFEAIADAAGAFELRALPPGDAYLSAEAPGFEPSQGMGEQALALGEACSDVVLRLRALVPIRGRVTDERGIPIAGAEVTARTGRESDVFFFDGTSSLTDAGGSYSIDTADLELPFAVTASAAGCKRLERTGVAAGSSGVDFALERLPAVLVSVRDATTDAPIAAARAALVRSQGGDPNRSLGPGGRAAFAAGLIQLTVPEPGTYAVIAEAPGYLAGALEGLRLDGSSGAGPLVLRLAAAPAVPTFAIHVVGADGAPIAGAQVKLLRAGDARAPAVWRGIAVPVTGIGRVEGTAAAGADGTCTFSRAVADESGALLARATAPGFGTALAAVDPAGTTIVAMQAAAELSGTVLDMTGAPARHVPVIAWHEAGAVAAADTDGAGGYRLADLAPGAWQLAVGNLYAKERAYAAESAAPAALALAQAILAPGARERLDLDLRAAGGGVRGTVRVDSVPRMSRRVLARPAEAADAPAHEAWTGAAGDFAFPCLAPGRYAVELAHGSGVVLLATEVAVTAGRTEVVDLALATGRVRGRAYRADNGAPFAGSASAALLLPGHSGDDAPRLDACNLGDDGAFRLTELPAGRYRVAVRSMRSELAAREVDVTAGAEVALAWPIEAPGTARFNVTEVPRGAHLLLARIAGAGDFRAVGPLIVTSGAARGELPLPPGSYRAELELAARSGRLRGPAVEFSIAPDATTEVPFGAWREARP